MRTISTTELKAAALQYYNEKKLTAQCESKYCVLEDNNGCRCAIGAAMTEEEIQDSGASHVLSLVVDNIVGFEDIDFAERLQQSHDAWCKSFESFGDTQATWEVAFLALVQT